MSKKFNAKNASILIQQIISDATGLQTLAGNEQSDFPGQTSIDIKVLTPKNQEIGSITIREDEKGIGVFNLRACLIHDSLQETRSEIHHQINQMNKDNKE